MLVHHYHAGSPVPDEILVSSPPQSPGAIIAFFKQISGHTVTIYVPQRGPKYKLMQLAKTNLKHRLSSLQNKPTLQDNELKTLKTLLNLPKVPVTIEAVDISESHGKYAVGSIVTFCNGKPDKRRYRRFKIKETDANNDIARIKELLSRRLRKQNISSWSLPDLILIDGGKNQLMAGIETLSKYSKSDVTIISLAKVRNNRKVEGIFLKSGSEIRPPPNSPGIKYLDRIRDEAHRFAITYHRNLRNKATLRSHLDGIPNIGHKRKVALIRKFGSIEQIKNSSIEEISKVQNIGRKIAISILNALNS